MKHPVTTRPAGNRCLVDFIEPNAMGERLTIEYSKQVFDNANSYSLARLWHKHGLTDVLLETAWVISDYCYDADGHCHGNHYNPQVKLHPGGGRYVIDFDWKKEGTPEELDRLLDEVERRFYGEKESA